MTSVAHEGKTILTEEVPNALTSSLEDGLLAIYRRPLAYVPYLGATAGSLFSSIR